MAPEIVRLFVQIQNIETMGLRLNFSVTKKNCSTHPRQQVYSIVSNTNHPRTATASKIASMATMATVRPRW